MQLTYLGNQDIYICLNQATKMNYNMTSRIRYTNKGIFEQQSNIGHTCALSLEKKAPT